MTDLVEFLNARLDEDAHIIGLVQAERERQAHIYSPGAAPDPQEGGMVAGDGNMDNPSVIIGPGRAMAEVEAKRRIVDLHEQWPVLIEEPPEMEMDDQTGSLAARMTQRMAWLTTQEYRARFGDEPPTSSVLRLLALPYADHPDYRQEWRP